MHRLILQLIKFGAVGAVAFLIDYGLLYVLSEKLGMWYLPAAFISFSVSTVFNYFASMRYVFSGRKGMSKRRQFIIFTLLCVIALGLNELLMWVSVDIIGVETMISKLFVTAIVMIWNFVSRKVFLDEKNEK